MVIGTIEFICRAAEVLPVYKDLLTPLRILGCGVAPANEFLGAGRRQLKALEIAVEQWQSFHHPGIKRSCHVSSVGFQLRRFGSDFDGLLSTTYLKLRIHARSRVHRNDDVFVLYGFEAWRFYTHRVNVWDQVCNGIVTIRVCSRLIGRALSLVGNRHLRIGHGRTLGIGNRTENAAVDRLGKSRGRSQGENQECQSDCCQDQSPSHSKFLRRSFRHDIAGAACFPWKLLLLVFEVGVCALWATAEKMKPPPDRDRQLARCVELEECLKRVDSRQLPKLTRKRGATHVPMRPPR